MIKGRATTSGTAAYAARFPNLPGNYRPAMDLAVSSIGIGTYLGEHDARTDAAYSESLRLALSSGINLIDTAVNYRMQRSERVIGQVLKESVEIGMLKREEVVIATKGGYVTFDGDMPPDPRTWFQEHFVRTGIVQPGDLVDGSHCMTPKWLAAMIELSRANLGVETIDIYYVHNPENQLAQIGRTDFRRRLQHAFELLERKTADGVIGCYGAATWNGFRIESAERAYLSLAEIIEAAERVAGHNHHFRIIQLPYNLAMTEAFTARNQPIPGDGLGNTLAAAEAAGITVCASASLLQGRLSRRLPPLLEEAFGGLGSDAQRAVQFVRSTPGVSCALVGMSTAAHVRDIIATAERPPAPFDSMMKLFQSAE
ncbi:MAG TPA: aldo/keto reductase [Candidatus Binataceae bacterium]|nr:aldo/keto reductase [Candidatus Binataceae bacterium]